MHKLFWIALAGALGTLARYGFGGLVQRSFGGILPWGTLGVNIAGCFLAGALWSLAESRVFLSGEMRAVIFIGFMGAFTTFSSLMLETSALARDGEWLWALGNLAAHNLIGFGAVWLGIILGRLI
ncbi:MAG: fluoride efflux transporter FluC [Candidatus Latescibacterota bacterium]